MRRAARVDENQDRIVQTLRRAGIAVRVLSQMGGGVPDLLAQHRDGRLVLLEVKNGALSASRRKLTPLEKKFQETWPVSVVNNEREALAACGIKVLDES
jgi:hypothetical protein